MFEDYKSSVKFIQVTSDSLLQFLNQAKKRIIIAKPGYRKEEIEKLLELIDKLSIECRLFIDPDENVIRWGFGEHSAVKLVKENTDKLNVQTADRIRLSIVVVDDLALVYSPVALSWEKEPISTAYPNGIMCEAILANEFIQLLKGATVEEPDEPHKVIPFPGCIIHTKSTQNIVEDLKKTDEKLDKKPPVDPAKLRKISVYRNNYKILKIETRGVNLKTKSLGLHPINNLLPKINMRLKASWIVFTKDEVDAIDYFKIFKDEIEKIKGKYLLDVKRYGYLIKTDDMKAFEESIRAEKQEFTKFLKAKTQGELDKLNTKYAKKNKEREKNISKSAKIDQQIDLFQPGNINSDASNNNDNSPNLGIMVTESKLALKKYYSSVILSDDESEKSILGYNPVVNKMCSNGTLEKEKAINSILDELIENRLKFPDPDKLAEDVDVKIDPYDVSDELLYQSKEFRDCIEELKDASKPENEIKLRKFSDAFEPLTEY